MGRSKEDTESRATRNDDGLREEGGEPAPRDNHLPQTARSFSKDDSTTNRNEQGGSTKWTRGRKGGVHDELTVWTCTEGGRNG